MNKSEIGFYTHTHVIAYYERFFFRSFIMLL